MVVLEEHFRQHVEVPRAKDDEVVEAFDLQPLDEAFDIGLGIR